MTDRDLNEAMARLCGVKLYRCTDCWVACAFESKPLKPSVAWNPCGDWNQVHDFVIPALQRRGLGTFIFSEKDEHFVMVQPFDWSWEATVHTQENAIPARCACEVALEAWENLEK